MGELAGLVVAVLVASLGGTAAAIVTTVATRRKVDAERRERMAQAETNEAAAEEARSRVYQDLLKRLNDALSAERIHNAELERQLITARVEAHEANGRAEDAARRATRAETQTAACRREIADLEERVAELEAEVAGGPPPRPGGR